MQKISLIWKINFTILVIVGIIYFGLDWFNNNDPEQIATETNAKSNQTVSEMNFDKATPNVDDSQSLVGVSSEDRIHYQTINKEIRDVSKKRDAILSKLNNNPDDVYLERALEELDSRLYQLQSEASYLDEQIRSPQSKNEPDL